MEICINIEKCNIFLKRVFINYNKYAKLRYFETGILYRLIILLYTIINVSIAILSEIVLLLQVSINVQDILASFNIVV